MNCNLGLKRKNTKSVGNTLTNKTKLNNSALAQSKLPSQTNCCPINDQSQTTCLGYPQNEFDSRNEDTLEDFKVK